MRHGVRGRGAQSSAVPQRFGLAERLVDDDWRDVMRALDGESPKLRTTVVEEHPRSILTFNESPDIAFDRSITVGISVTTLDPMLSGKLEPRAASPAKRLAALGKLVEAGVPVHCSIAPVIPAITDCYMEQIIASAADQGVRSAGWIMLRLPHEVSPLFREWLDVHFPDRAKKVMGIVQSVRNGRDNDGNFFSRMRPQGVWAELFRTRFRIASKRHGMTKGRFELDCCAFRPPNTSGQLQLF